VFTRNAITITRWCVWHGHRWMCRQPLLQHNLHRHSRQWDRQRGAVPVCCRWLSSRLQ